MPAKLISEAGFVDALDTVAVSAQMVDAFGAAIAEPIVRGVGGLDLGEPRRGRILAIAFGHGGDRKEGTSCR